MDTIINNENFILFVQKLANGVKQSKYNDECYSTSEVARNKSMREVLDIFIQKVEDAGYCPFRTMNKLMKPYGQWVEGNRVKGIKKQIDSNLHIDMSQFQQALHYCEIQWDILQKKAN
ncbi:hypothetical protein CN918_25470 [Priestia megaterium]|nr:hypothetical protein CN918_25470 [Priestia megaterium]